MNEESIFASALEKPTGAERQAFLEEACSDLRLRLRVEQLLAAHERSCGILERGPDGGCRPEPPLASQQAFAGRFRLCDKLGEGGMGEVWVADQLEPVRRRVALKVIRAGLDSVRMLGRFDQERQVLALMDHPNIARVFEAGVAGGRPFFVMEFIDGLPITRYCDQANLSPRARLELFLPICHAVQHAHQKGIIHRDLKPSNILVALFDGVPVPKVIDFGIAKATGARLGDLSVATEVGTLVGTLEYMSPEQTDLNNLDIDTRSDVYSLGVLLYELLTGSVPFSRTQLQSVAFTEMLRTIKEVEPPRPSTNLAEPPTLPGVAGVRQTEPKKLKALLQGELDWIVMKCLEKDPERRYETASGLAEDIQRYLANEPVRARPPSAGYRLRKFVTRHRVPVLAATVVVLALLAGIVGTTWGLAEAWEQWGLTELARQDAVSNAERAKAAQTRAEKQLSRAEWLLYASRINLAQQAFEDHDAILANQYLESCRPDLRGWEHDYLFTLFNRKQQTFRGQPSGVACIALSDDGKWLAAGHWNGAISVWDVATGKLARSLKKHTGEIISVACSPKGECLASGSGDGTVKVWDLFTGRELLTLAGHKGRVRSVAFSPDGRRIVSGSEDHVLKVWDAATGQCSHTYTGHREQICGVAFSPNGKRIVSASNDNTLKVWDADTGQERFTLDGHTEYVNCVTVSADGTRIVSGGSDRTVKVWDAATGRDLLTITGHKHSFISGVAISADGKRIVSGSYDGTVKVWDAATGKELHTLAGHRGEVNAVAYAADGKRIVSGSSDRTVKFWDLAEPAPTLTLAEYSGAVSSLACNRDGTRLVSGGIDGTVRLWDARTGRELRALTGHTGEIVGLAFSPDGKHFASASLDQTVRVWDADTVRNTATFTGHTHPVNCVVFGVDGKRIVSGGQGKSVRIWDVQTGRELFAFEPDKELVLGVALSPDGKQLASGGWDETVRLWDAATGRNTLILVGHKGPVFRVAYDPDGKRLVSGSNDHTIKVWDVETGQELLTLRGHAAGVSSVGFSPDGKRIFSGGYDKTVKIWDAASGHETLTLKGPSHWLACSPDGKRIFVSRRVPGTFRVLDASMRLQSEFATQRD